MKSVVDSAVKFLCTKTLGFEVEDANTLGKGFYGSSIPLYKDGAEFHFYLFFKRDTLKHFARAFFGSKDLQDADLDDLCKEIANQIVGKAKIILSETDGSNYKLGTPEFLGEVANFNVKLDEKLIYKMKNRTFQIGFKRV